MLLGVSLAAIHHFGLTFICLGFAAPPETVQLTGFSMTFGTSATFGSLVNPSQNKVRYAGICSQRYYEIRAAN